MSHTRQCLEKAAWRGQTLKAMPNIESYQLYKFFFLSAAQNPGPKSHAEERILTKYFG